METRNLASHTIIALLSVGLFLNACSSTDTGSKNSSEITSKLSSKPYETKPIKDTPMIFEGPGEKLSPVLGAWKIHSAPRYFGPDNLYDLINGGAEIYVQFGLVKMVTADYQKPDQEGLTVTAEIYDMGTPLGAFGRTSRFLQGLMDPSNAGKGLPSEMSERGILGVGDLIVWKHQYMIHLTLMDERVDATPEFIEKATGDILPPFAQSILAKIKDHAPNPSDLLLFPPENRIARSDAWEPRKLLGVQGLNAGFSVRYKNPEGYEWLTFATEKISDEMAMNTAWESFKSAPVDKRQAASKIVGSRIVGVIQEGENTIPDDIIEKQLEIAVNSFQPK